jgi:hypothetical protein
MAWFIPILQFVAAAFTVISLAKSLTQKSPRSRLDQLKNRGHLVNTRSTDWYKPLIYGPCRAGGNIEYRGVSGDDNRYLHIILKIGWGPLEGIYREDGSIWTDTATEAPSSNPPLIYLDGELWTETVMVDNCYFEFFSGSSSQNVCSTLNSAIAEFTDPYRYEAYLYARFLYDEDKFLSVPVITAKVAGLQCYDPTTDTLEYSENFALHCYDMLTRAREIGGAGLDQGYQCKVLSAAEDSGTNTSPPSWAIAPDTFGPIDCTGLTKANGFLCIELKCTDWGQVNATGAKIEITSSGAADNEEWYHDGIAELDVSTTYKTFKIPLSEFETQGGELDVSQIDYLRFAANLDEVETIYWQNARIEWDASGADEIRINTPSVEEARAYCEAKSWEGGFIITGDDDLFSDLSIPLQCFRGDIVGADGEFKFRFRDINYESVAMDIDETDIEIKNGQSTLELKPRSRFRSRPNTLLITHFDADLNYQKNEYQYHDGDAITSDGGVREKRINLLGLNDIEAVQKMASYALERERWGVSGSFSGRQSLAQLEPMDLIRLSHTMPGYDDQYFRVQSVGADASGAVSIGIEEEALGLYDDNYSIGTLVRHVPPMVDLTVGPPSVYNGSISEENRATRLRSGTALIIDFDPPDNYPFWRGARVYLRIGAGGTWQYMTEVKSGYELFPAQEGVEYFFRLQSVNIHGIGEDLNNCYSMSKTVAGVTTNPGNVTGLAASATGSVLSVTATPITDADVVGYEIRIGSTWASSVFLAMLLDTPDARIAGVTPGTQTIWIAAKNNAGLYSSTPASTTVDIPYPSNYTYQSITNYDFTAGEGGTFDDAEHTTYDFGSGSVDALKASHGSGLVGTWTSPTTDMGSVKRAKIFAGFATAFVEGNKQWSSLLTKNASQLWSDVLTDQTTWNWLWTNLYSAGFQVTLEYGDSAVNENEFTAFGSSYFEDDCRYYRVVITITDPEDSANLYLENFDLYEQTYT